MFLWLLVLYIPTLLPWLCVHAGVPEDYEVPLQGMVPPDPTFEDMRRVVVVERRQPAIPPRWNTDSEEVYTVHACIIHVCTMYV